MERTVHQLLIPRNPQPFLGSLVDQVEEKYQNLCFRFNFISLNSRSLTSHY